MTQTLHLSLKRTLKECQDWWARAVLKDRLNEAIQQLREDLELPSPISRVIRGSTHDLGHTYSIRACIDLSIKIDPALDDGQSGSLTESLHWAVAFGSLSFRFESAVPAKSPTNLPLPFRSSMQAAGPAMLSQWEEARSCAHWLIDVAHREQAFGNNKYRKDGWGKGTNDAFLIFLFAQAFDLPTHYRPVNPLIPAYQNLLDCWRTDDQARFQQAIQAAAEFHISRSKDSTEKHDYEFEKLLDRVFPAELLAVQALRRRDGLPEFETGHALIDTPWAVIRDLPDAAPHPLAIATETRLRQDYPAFF